MLAVDEVVHHARLQGAGTKQCHQGDDVLEAVRSQALDQVLHPAGFQLEYRRGFRRLQQLEAGLVVQRDQADIQRLLALPLPHGIYHFHRPVDNRQGAQPEKIELDESRVLHVALVVLGDQATAGFVAEQRGEIRQFRGRDNNTPGMLADVAGNALQLHRHIPDFLGLGVVPQEIPQGLFLLQGLGQGHAHFERDHLRQLVGQAVGLALYPGHVAHHRLGGHGAEGNNLGDRFAAVGIGHIVDYPVALLHAEIDIEVRHRDPLGVEEALEQQVVFQRVQVGDFQRVGHQGAGAGSAPGTHRYVVLLGPANEVHDDQEVTRETHLDDGIQLEIQALAVACLLLREITGRGVEQHCQTPLQPLVGLLPEKLVDAHTRRHRVVRQEGFAQLQYHVAAPRDLHRIGQGLGNIGKQIRHFRRGAQVLLVGIDTRAPGVVQGPPLADTHPRLVGLELRGIEETDIVGRDHRALQLARQRHRRVYVGFIALAPGAVQLQVKTVRVQLHPLPQAVGSKFGLAAEQGLPHFTRRSGGQGDHALGTLLQPGLVNIGHTQVLPLGKRPGDEQGQVAIALQVHRQQAQGPGPVGVVRVQYPQIDADDGLHTRAEGGLVHFDQAVEVADIGHRHRRHAEGGHPLHQRLDPHQAIDEGVFSVQAQVDEVGHPMDSTWLVLIVVLPGTTKPDIEGVGYGFRASGVFLGVGIAASRGLAAPGARARGRSCGDAPASLPAFAGHAGGPRWGSPCARAKP